MAAPTRQAAARRSLVPCAVGTALVLLLPAVAANQPKTEKLEGYAEWLKGPEVVVDGQRITADRRTKFKGKGVTSLAAIPLGYQVSVKGVRLPDGRIAAAEVEAQANGTELFEKEVRQATDQLEAKWLQSGGVVESDKEGREHLIGRTVDAGGDVERARRILARVTPPYVGPSAIRLHVVDTKEWNAMAMGNGAVWIYTGLLHDMNDDEVAIVVGHELAHFTHEHTRRSFRKAMWSQLILVGVAVAAEQADSDAAKGVIGLAGTFSVLAFVNGYGRDLEDQADRVGLRYAYEGGYDVRRGPALWQRFRDKYGDQNRLANFFLGSHSVASARIRNLNREIAFNYRTPAT